MRGEERRRAAVNSPRIRSYKLSKAVSEPLWTVSHSKHDSEITLSLCYAMKCFGIAVASARGDVGGDE